MNLRFADKLVFGLLFSAAFLLLISLLFFNFGEAVAFYVLTTIMLFSASGVVLVRDVIRSAFLLALCFLCLGGLYVVLNASFLAAAQILIYAGAVAILFVFGIMLTRRSEKEMPSDDVVDTKLIALLFGCLGVMVILNVAVLIKSQAMLYAGLAVLVMVAFPAFMTWQRQGEQLSSRFDFKMTTLIFVGLGVLALLIRGLWTAEWNLADVPASADTNTVAAIGQQFFGAYLLPFEIASILLLMALMGAIVIAKKEPHHE